ncbi:hypothetical protein C0Q70_05593 [Pomacea canaliculata]|uniref:Uncharacterized protein n=1 Tax=Pomacea canaliculata TaxID=400727 RepID=A0A2T7PLQ4_POMCA|nr:hypothetical protein C0Q70_05593 [Pomacea canaliculata]
MPTITFSDINWDIADGHWNMLSSRREEGIRFHVPWSMAGHACLGIDGECAVGNNVLRLRRFQLKTTVVAYWWHGDDVMSIRAHPA